MAKFCSKNLYSLIRDVTKELACFLGKRQREKDKKEIVIYTNNSEVIIQYEDAIVIENNPNKHLLLNSSMIERTFSTNEIN